MSFASARMTFSGQMPLSSPKKRVKSKKSFSVQFKEKKRARDMQLLSPQASIGCCGLSFSITGLIFSGKMPLGTPKKRVKSKHMQWLEVDSIIYYIIRAFFEGGIALREAVSA